MVCVTGGCGITWKAFDEYGKYLVMRQPVSHDSILSPASKKKARLKVTHSPPMNKIM